MIPGLKKHLLEGSHENIGYIGELAHIIAFSHMLNTDHHLGSPGSGTTITSATSVSYIPV